ncbi:DUF2931 family protein [Formosa sediminum]|uniref:DUF2931 family protein n=1 Tax=Formosa sediminum TaxID=2594004 RepID=A0A516GS46_9FLAO|nr:DUF2931 family protein [Formosa sediminum]QDO94351.1 DUF2931 family protein [Formosa sediminum]
MNNFNKFLITLTLILAVTYGYVIVTNKPWSKYYYQAFAFYPNDFPIEISQCKFTSNSEKQVDYDYYSEINVSDYVAWSSGGYSSQTNKKRFLPDNIYLEYIDLQTKAYYRDTIPLPKSKMEDIFKKAKQKYMLQNLDTYYTRMGLTLHIGIANDGNILVWIGNTDKPKTFQIEVLRTKILPKKFPKQWNNKTEVLMEQVLKNVSEEKLKALEKGIDSTANYKDSIPRGFKNLITNL